MVVKHIAKICIMHLLGCCSSLLLHNLHNRINLHLSSSSFVFHYNWLMEILGKATIARSPFTFCLLSLVLLLLLSLKPQDLHHCDASLWIHCTASHLIIQKTPFSMEIALFAKVTNAFRFFDNTPKGSYFS